LEKTVACTPTEFPLASFTMAKPTDEVKYVKDKVAFIYYTSTSRHVHWI